MGSKWAQGVVEEWVGNKDPVMWGLKGSMYGRARGEAVEQIRDRCREAAIQEPGQIAEAATLVMMELLWGIKRVFKREVWNATTKGRQEEECEGEILDSIMVYGKDATRGHYRLPPEAKVNHRRLGNGRKLKAGQKDRERKPHAEY